MLEIQDNIREGRAQNSKEFYLFSRHDSAKLAGGTACVVHEVSVCLAADGDTRGHAGLLHGAKHLSYGLSRCRDDSGYF